MGKLVEESTEGTLPVNACVLVKTLVLDIYESVTDMLRDTVDGYGDTVGTTAYLCKLYLIAVLVIAVNKGRIGKVKAVQVDIYGRILSELHYIHGKSCRNDRHRDDNYKYKRKKHGSDNGKGLFNGACLLLFSFLLFWSGSRLSHMLGSCFVSGFFGEFLFVAQNIFLLIRDMLGHKHVILHYIT